MRYHLLLLLAPGVLTDSRGQECPSGERLGKDEATRGNMDRWTGCIAGALTRSEYLRLVTAAGFSDAGVEETHRVHPSAGSGIVRPHKPA
jgi:hypothetical protein